MNGLALIDHLFEGPVSKHGYGGAGVRVSAWVLWELQFGPRQHFKEEVPEAQGSL